MQLGKKLLKSSATRTTRAPRISFFVAIAFAWAAFSAVPMRAATFALGTTSLVEGPAAGSDSVVLSAGSTNSWTATTNATWLHLANPKGAGSTNVIFNFNANPGITRTGSLTIAGMNLTITQAGSTYVAISLPPVTVVGSGLHAPTGLSVGPRGNVYFADTDDNIVRKWIATNNTVATVTTNGFNGSLSAPAGLAVDGAGNVYIADSGNSAIEKWLAANNTVTTLVSNGLADPWGVAVDGATNLYVADTLHNALGQLTVISNTPTMITLASNGLFHPFNLAIDAATNIYIADYGDNAVKRWKRAGANSILTAVITNLSSPAGVAVDGSGNVYVADTGNNAIKEWIAASNTVSTLAAAGLSEPFGVAVDGAGNIYFSDTLDNAIKELPRAFVDPTPELEGTAAGSDTLPGVLPATENLAGPFAPASDQPWLSITGITNGVVSFAFSSSNGTNRTGHITVLGQAIPVTQTTGIVASPMLAGAAVSAGGLFQFSFSGSQGASYTVLWTTNLLVPLTNWPVAGAPANVSPGVFQFTVPVSQTDPQRFYRIRSP